MNKLNVHLLKKIRQCLIFQRQAYAQACICVGCRILLHFYRVPAAAAAGAGTNLLHFSCKHHMRRRRLDPLLLWKVFILLSSFIMYSSLDIRNSSSFLPLPLISSGVVTMLWLNDQRFVGKFLGGGATYFPPLPRIQSNSGTNPTSSYMDTKDYLTGDKAVRAWSWTLTYIYCSSCMQLYLHSLI